MPTAHFIADFTKFNTAVENAEVKLKSFESGAGKVSSALTRMANSLSGQKVIQDATLMAAAVDKVGGVSKLTQAELRRVGATAQEAVAKMQKLGIGVPENLQRIAKAAKDAEGSTRSFGGTVGRVAEMAAGFVSAQAVLSGVSAAFSFVSKAAIGTNATLEKTTLQFATLMGNAEQAQKHVKDLFEIAKKTPFETGPIIQASLKLQTFGGAALNTKENILLLGDAAAATNAPIEDLGFWVGRLYSQLQGGQKFGEAAMRLQELAVMTPQARREMEAMQAAGKSANEIFDHFKSTLGAFTGAMEKQAGTWEGVVSTFTDTINILIADTLRPYFEVIRDLGRAVNDTLDKMTPSLGNVKNSVADTKQSFVEFIRSGLEGTVSAMSFLMVEFNAAQVVFRDVMQLVDLTALGFKGLALAVAEALSGGNRFGPFREDVARIAGEMDMIRQRIAARSKALQDDKSAQQDWVAWGKNANAQIETMVGTLGAHAAASDATAKSTTRAAAAVNILSKEQEKANKAAAKVAEVYDNANSSLADLSESTIQAIKYYKEQGLSVAQITKLVGVYQKQVEDVIDAQKDAADMASQMGKAIADTEADFDKARQAAEKLRDEIVAIERQGLSDKNGVAYFNEDLKGLGVTVAGITDGELADFIDRMKFVGPLLENAGNDANTFANRLDRAFSAVATILDNISGKVAETATVIARGLQEAFKAFAKGDWVSGLVASVTTGLQVLGNAIFHTVEKQVNKTRQAFVDAAGGLDALNKKAHDAGVTLEALLKAKTPEAYQKAIDDLNKAFEEHEKKIAKVKAIIDGLGPSFSKIVGAFTADFSRAADIAKRIKEDLDKRTSNGVVSKATEDTVKLLKEQQKVAAEFKGQLEDLGVLAAASIGAALEAGYSLSEAIAMNHDGLKTLRDAYTDLGLKVEDAFMQALLVQDALVTNNPALLQGVSALASSMEGLEQLGLLNVDTFEAMERTGMAMYTRLQGEVAKVGGSTKDALLPMQEYLHKAQEAAEALGQPLDENLQMLIDQSKELGIWKDKGKSATDLLNEGLQKLLEKLDQFFSRLMNPPQPGEINIPVKWDIPDMPSMPEVIPMASGGMGRVTKPTLFLAGEKGSEDFAFSGGGKSFASSPMPSTTTVQVVLDGKVIAESTVRQIEHGKGGLDRRLKRKVAA